MTDYRKSKVCGSCWMQPARRRFYMLHVAGRWGRCDFCRRWRKVWVTMEPTRRTWPELLLYCLPRPMWPSPWWRCPASDGSFWDLDYVDPDAAEEADARACKL